MEPLRIALPNKGRLSQKALELFERAGLPPSFRAERALVAGLGKGYQALFVRAQDIPEFVADGAADLGITGADLVLESERDTEELLDLGFGRCRLIVATRSEAELSDPKDLVPGTRVATSFPNLTRRYFADLGIPIEIAPISGAAEIAPHLGVADVIVDLSSTGSTLRVNGLREIATILDSTARLVANRQILEDSTRRGQAETLVTALESVLRAREKRYLMANVPRARLEEVRALLPGISGPTVVDVLERPSWVAAHAVVDADRVFDTIASLKALGAEGILVTPIERLTP